MHSVLFDPKLDDAGRRIQIYDGQLVIYSPTPSSLALVKLARELIGDAFGAIDPETAQYHMPVEEYATLLAKFKPEFIHHPESKRSSRACCASWLRPREDLLRRAANANGDERRLLHDAASPTPFIPHRDTWYSAPQCQINWWMPIYEIESGRSMAFHPRYWTQPVRNSSRTYNYAEWNQHQPISTRRSRSGKDTRMQPRAEEPMEVDPQIARHLPGRRHRVVLGCANAFDRAEQHGPHALQHRLPDR